MKKMKKIWIAVITLVLLVASFSCWLWLIPKVVGFVQPKAMSTVTVETYGWVHAHTYAHHPRNGGADHDRTRAGGG